MTDLASRNYYSYLDNSNVSKFEYLLVLLFLIISGNPITNFTSEWLYIITMSVLFCYAIIQNKPVRSNAMVKWIVGFFVIFVAQAISGELVSYNADINFSAKLYSCFLLASIIGDKFRYVYMKIMVMISFISFPLFAINYIGMEFGGIRFDRYVSLILYNYIPRSQFIEMRNCGMFWEPGAFQGYLMLVPLLYIGNIVEFFRAYKKECYILIVALLTTMSTTGYLALLLLLLLVVVKNVKNSILRIVAVVIMIIASQWAFNNFDFIGSKILGQYENAKSMSTGEVSWTRMGAAQVDIENIARHPLIGNGFLMEQKYLGIGELMAGAGNGFTGVINSFGIPFILIFLYFVYKRAPSISSYDKMIFLVIYILLLNGEYFLNYPLFWIVLFLIYPNYPSYEESSSINDRI